MLTRSDIHVNWTRLGALIAPIETNSIAAIQIESLPRSVAKSFSPFIGGRQLSHCLIRLLFKPHVFDIEVLYLLIWNNKIIAFYLIVIVTSANTVLAVRLTIFRQFASGTVGEKKAIQMSIFAHDEMRHTTIIQLGNTSRINNNRCVNGIGDFRHIWPGPGMSQERQSSSEQVIPLIIESQPLIRQVPFLSPHKLTGPVTKEMGGAKLAQEVRGHPKWRRRRNIESTRDPIIRL